MRNGREPSGAGEVATGSGDVGPGIVPALAALERKRPDDEPTRWSAITSRERRAATVRRLSQSFVAEPQAVPAARRSIGALDGLIDERTRDTLGVLVSELVANAVTHGSKRSGDTVRMRVWTSPVSVRVAVSDRGPRFARPAQPVPAQLEVGGWGLMLVERLADRWGVSERAQTEVWFEIDTDPTPGRPSPRGA